MWWHCCPSLMGWSKGSCWAPLFVPCELCWGCWRGWALAASPGCVCVGGVGEEALKFVIFLVFQCPTSSSALTSFFTCKERITVLSMNLVILLMCQRSINLTHWWIYRWMAMMYSQSLDRLGLCGHSATLAFPASFFVPENVMICEKDTVKFILHGCSQMLSH